MAQMKPVSFYWAKTTRPYAPFPNYFIILNFYMLIFGFIVMGNFFTSMFLVEFKKEGDFFTPELSEYLRCLGT